MVPILSPALASRYPDRALVTYEEWGGHKTSVAPALRR